MKKPLTALFVIGLLAITPLVAQEKAKDTTDTKKSEKSIIDITKSCQKFPGLFNMYQDTVDGKVYLEISADKLGDEFIHFFHVENGALDAGWVKGSYGTESVFTIHKSFDKIEFLKQNPHFYFDPDNEVSRSAGANINQPVISIDKIIASSEKQDTFLIEANKLFLTEAWAQLKYLPPPGSKNKNPFKIGSLSKEKSRFESIHSYPMNVDVMVNYVYENKYPTNFGRITITDPRYTSVQVQHSLIRMPENDYQPRYDDPRVGYFTTRVTDQTATGTVTPYRDKIHRWHLVKKDPNAAISEPVEPIVFWMENTTPMDIRPLVKKGVEAWNVAFEKAGFRNAVVVKQQPDDADWDAGDIRYNVLRWTAAPMMGSAWGPSFVNPRTGQILGADIMLDYVFVRGINLQNKLFLEDSKGLDEIMFEPHQDPIQHSGGPFACNVAGELAQDMLLGHFIADALDFSPEDEQKLKEEILVWLMLHEVGHTLGLNHNFKSSQIRSPEELDQAETLSGSVMDYNTNHYAFDNSTQGHFRNQTPGPYDLWAIEFGYTPSLENEMEEAQRLQALLQRSTEPELLFGNDADAMGSPGFGIDPTITRWDLSSDALTYGEDRVKLSRYTASKLKDKLNEDGKSYHELRIGYITCLGMYNSALSAIKHYVGGVKIDRGFIGQPNSDRPLTPISYQEQKRAMRLLVEYGFSPRAYLAPSDIYAYLQIQRRGFDMRRYGNEDPKIHERIARYQSGLLAHLMHPTVLRRMTNSRFYDNSYSVSEMFSDLTKGIFDEDLNTEVSTTRQNLQHSYVDGLISALSNPKYDHISKSAALYEIQQIDDLMKSNKGKDRETKAHRDHIRFKINKALDKKG